MANNQLTQRIFGLDFLRTIAILIVMFFHGGILLDNTPLEGFPYIPLVGGVDIFFVLSGYLIGTILLKKINGAPSFSHRQLVIFWKRRWFRTLPAYYLILLLNILFIKYGILDGDLTKFNFHFLSFTQNFKEPFFGFFWESWSLSIEEWFYIFAPILLVGLLKVTKPKLGFLLTTFLMIIIPTIYRISIYDLPMEQFYADNIIRKTVLCRLDTIGFGLLAAWLCYYYYPTWKKYKLISFILGMGILFSILYSPFLDSILYRHVVIFPMISLFVVLILPMAESIKTVNGFVPKCITHISKISYSMYLINLSLVLSAITKYLPARPGIDGVAKYCLFWAAVIAGATFLYYTYEKPMTKIRDKI